MCLSMLSIRNTGGFLANKHIQAIPLFSFHFFLQELVLDTYCHTYISNIYTLSSLTLLQDSNNILLKLIKLSFLLKLLRIAAILHTR